MPEVGMVERPRARMGRYALWQMRDYAVGAGGATAALSVLVLALAVAGGLPDDPANRASVLRSVLGAAAVVGAVAGVSGLVSDDRTKGYYRFALAKPVSATRLYGQAFAVRGAALLGLLAAIWITGTVVMGAGSLISDALPRLLLFGAVAYVLIGGVTFALSTITRFAWLGTVALYAAAGIAGGLAQSSHWSRPPWAVAHMVLPPFGQVSALYRDLLGLSPSPMERPVRTIAWIAGYGAAAIAAGLAILRRREWPR
jgi:ABC-type transport system involved in multi-copper enzyme maturation permease subunit